MPGFGLEVSAVLVDRPPFLTGVVPQLSKEGDGLVVLRDQVRRAGAGGMSHITARRPSS